MVWLTDEGQLALLPAGTIVRDSHHCQSLTHRKQDLNLGSLVEWCCAVAITTTPWHATKCAQSDSKQQVRMNLGMKLIKINL